MNKWISWVLKHQKLTLFFIVVATVIFALGLPDLSLSTDANKIIKIKESAKDISKRDIRILVHDKQLLHSKEKIALLDKLQEQLKQIPGITKISSIYTIPNLRHYFLTDELKPVVSVSRLNPEELDESKRALANNRLYLNRFISHNLTTTLIIARVNTKKNSELALYKVRDQVEELLEQYQTDFQNIYQIGSIEVSYELREATLRDIVILSSIAVFVLIALFSLFFRKLLYGLLPFITSSLALVWSLGILSFLDISLNIFSGLAVIITFSIGIMECAHFIHAYQHSVNQHSKTENKTGQDIHLKHMIKTVLMPILFATLTTVLGFALNITSESIAISDIGIIICLSIIINTFLIFTLTLLILNKLGTNNLCTQATIISSFNRLFTLAFSAYQKLAKYKNTTVFILAGIILLGVYSALNTRIETIPYSGFYKDSPILKKVNLTTKLLSGIDYFAINIKANDPHAFEKKENLKKLFEAEQKINTIPNTSSTLSVATAMASLYQIYLDGEGDEFYQIPDRQFIIDKVIEEMGKREEFQNQITNFPQQASIFIVYKVLTTEELHAYLKKVNNIIREQFSKNFFQTKITNYYYTLEKTLFHVYQIQLVSLLLIYLTMFFIMTYLFKSVKAGLVSLIPNILPITIVITLIHFANIPIFGLTIIALAAVVGLAVDDTLHLMCAYKTALLETKENDSAIKTALETQVRPVTIASLSLILGMLALCFSATKGIMLFGAIMALGAGVAWLTDIMITPFLLSNFIITNNLIKK